MQRPRRSDPPVLETERLVLRPLRVDDDEFILRLLTGRSFLDNIGRRGVHDLASARSYIENGPRRMYREHGFGQLRVERREDGVPIGICGLLKRELLDDVDIGYALLPEFWARGYASEAAAAVLAWGRDGLGLDRIVAVVGPDNTASIRVLEKLGLEREGTVRLGADAVELLLFAWEAGRDAPSPPSGRR